MFSSLTSFLPSPFSLSPSSPPTAPAHQQSPPDPPQRTHSSSADDDGDHAQGVDEHGALKKAKKERSSETFIIVRPPPKKSNHPLNLQLQLVPPSAKQHSLPSSIAVPDDPTTPLSSTANIPLADSPPPLSARSQPDSSSFADQQTDLPRRSSLSNRSEALSSSYYSTHSQAGHSSVSSFSSAFSTSSTASGASGRRMIIPLYNLQAHNVLTNLVVDAGTDAKVAKFGKRGIELVGVAVLEPVEVFSARAAAAANARRAASPERTSLAQQQADPATPPNRRASVVSQRRISLHAPVPTSGGGGGGASRPGTPDTRGTPTSSAFSLASEDAQQHAQHAQQQHRDGPPRGEPPAGAGTPGTGARKMFGKLFRRREASSPGGGLAPSPSSSSADLVTPTATPPAAGRGGHSRTGSLGGAAEAARRRLSPLPPPTGKPLSGSGFGGRPGSSAGPPPPPPASAPIVQDFAHAQAFADIAEDGGSTTPRAAEKDKDRAAAPTARPTLGITPFLHSAAHPPVGRPAKYVWIVRRWIKTPALPSPAGLSAAWASAAHAPGAALVGLAGDLSARLGPRGGGTGAGAALVEVRFEWARAKGAGGGGGGGSARGRRRRAGSAGGASRSPVRPGSAAGAPAHLGLPAARRGTGDDAAKRLSGLSQATGSSAGERDTLDDDADAEEEEESDPEDSETPWTCTLRLSAGADAPPVKTKVGTLSPTPHHPKVLAALKVPFPLPDVDVARGAVLPRGAPGAEAGVEVGALVLSAEEIKDAVSTTALWLVVREGFGGVGRVSRKGDGWRIRK